MPDGQWNHNPDDMDDQCAAKHMAGAHPKSKPPKIHDAFQNDGTPPVEEKGIDDSDD